MSEDFSEILQATVEKQWGDGIIVEGIDVLDEPEEIISICPSLDCGLSGGVPTGSWVTFTGKPACGKTTTIMHFAAKCQQAGMKVIYENIEGRLKKMNLTGIPGLKLSDGWFRVVQSTKERILTEQDFLNIAMKILLTEERVLLIQDSWSALSPEQEMTGKHGVGTELRGKAQGILSSFCRQMASVVRVKKSIVVGVNHIMANVTGYGAGTLEKGANATRFQADVRIREHGVEPWMIGQDAEGKGGKQIGLKTKWVIEKSALGGIGSSMVSWIRFGRGVDEITEAIMLGIDFGLVQKKGSWYCLIFVKDRADLLAGAEWNEKEHQAQGLEKLYKLLLERPLVAQALKAAVGQANK